MNLTLYLAAFGAGALVAAGIVMDTGHTFTALALLAVATGFGVAIAARTTT